MSTPHRHFEIRCRACGDRRQIGVSDLLGRLRSGGAMRRNNDPDFELMMELAKTASGAWNCDACHAIGLAFRPIYDDPNDWNDARSCEACSQRIPPERVELFPNSTLCAACQRNVESGRTPVAEYCERCGSILTLKPTKSSGISRYVMYCPSCRR